MAGPNLWKKKKTDLIRKNHKHEYGIYSFAVFLFLKVAKANHAEGSVVVKVFVIHDPSLPLDTYQKRLQDVESRLRNVSNVLPYQKTMLYDKAALLVR